MRPVNALEAGAPEVSDETLSGSREGPEPTPGPGSPGAATTPCAATAMGAVTGCDPVRDDPIANPVRKRPTAENAIKAYPTRGGMVGNDARWPETVMGLLPER